MGMTCRSIKKMRPDAKQTFTPSAISMAVPSLAACAVTVVSRCMNNPTTRLTSSAISAKLVSCPIQAWKKRREPSNRSVAM